MITFPAAWLAIQGGMLSCSARGTPPIYTALIRNSKVLVNTTNTSTIRLYKDGNYTCQAINQYGTHGKELQVNFKSKRFSSGLISLFLSNIKSIINQLFCNLHDLRIEFSPCLERRLLKRRTTVALSDLASRAYACVAPSMRLFQNK